MAMNIKVRCSARNTPCLRPPQGAAAALASSRTPRDATHLAVQRALRRCADLQHPAVRLIR